MKHPFISVVMLAYNHEKYIIQAIEGVLMQQTTFPFELIIGEDCSTDNTRQICIEYREKYPDIIRLLLPENNLGVVQNSNNTIAATRGKYMAFCEGDDYWTDPLKLQKQVDFLESNPDYSICGGRYMVLEEGVSEMCERDWMIKGMKKYPKGRTVTLDNFYDNYLFWMVTVCIRRDCLAAIAKFEQSKDDLIYAVAMEQGKGFVLPDVFGVYRVHQGGIWSGKTIKQRLQENNVFVRMLYPHFANKSKSFRKKYYREIIGLKFFEITESEHLFKDFMKMLRFTFSGYLRDLPYRIGYFFNLTRVYFTAYCKKKLHRN